MELNTAPEVQSEIFSNDRAPERGNLTTHRPVPPDDICSGKHGGNFASVLAHEKAKLGKKEMYSILLDVFRQYPMGLTSHQLSEILGMPNRNQFAPRLSEMKAAGVLRQSEEMRDGCHVLKLLVRYFNEDPQI
jgi:hypothetical protein